MDIILQEAYHRKRMIQYCKNHTVTETAIRYKISRKTVYKWLKRWDGTIESLIERSRAPMSSPLAHSEQEIRLIRRLLKKHLWRDVILVYQELKERYGYIRSYGGLKRICTKLKKQKPPRKKKHKPKSYQKAIFPGQKLQVDVKYIPRGCHVQYKQYYQFTAIDEYSRWAFRIMYEEKSSYSAKDFLDKLIAAAPFKIKRIQTDNGAEFTNTLIVSRSKHKTLFEQTLEDYKIVYQRIRIATPRHNGKVERQHRTDEERLYSTLKMYSLDDGNKQLEIYNRRSNNYWKTCLGMKSPNQVLEEYLN